MKKANTTIKLGIYLFINLLILSLLFVSGIFIVSKNNVELDKWIPLIVFFRSLLFVVGLNILGLIYMKLYKIDIDRFF